MLTINWLGPQRVLQEKTMSQTLQEKNRALLLEGFDVLFNKRDFARAEKYWCQAISSTARISSQAEMDCSI
jgi:hypothetical protein